MRADTIPRTAKDTISVATPKRDTIPTGGVADSAGHAVPLPAGDTTHLRTDTLKTPLAHAPLPPATEIGEAWHWDRAELFASDALSLADLLDEIPGVTGLRGGWLQSPSVASYLGDPGTVRVFLDGVELDPLDRRDGGVTDLATIPLWTLEEVMVERLAGELRVHLRTWRVDRTTPSTRTDVLTGDLETNLYRGFYGRRFFNGMALQLAAQQYSTTDNRNGGGGDALDLFARLGWARGRWSADGLVQRTHRTRSDIARSDPAGAVFAGENDSRTTAWLRAAFGDPDAPRGFWAQVTAASSEFGETSTHRAAGATYGIATDSADTLRSRSQYVLSSGYAWRQVHASAVDRWRVFDGASRHDPEARLWLATPRLTVSLLGERAALDSSGALPASHRATRASASIRLLPLSFVALGAAYSALAPDDSLDGPTSHALRAEVGVRPYGRLWLSGGILTRDSALVSPAVAFDTAYRAAAVGRATGTFATIRGPIWHDVRADVFGVVWQDTAGYYRPRYEARTRVYLRTNWLRKFPTGHFTLIAAAMHEYRSNLWIPTAAGAVHAGSSRVLSWQLEFRILQASITWQYRNLLGYRYELVPGFEMPRQQNLYGVRWDFWN